MRSETQQETMVGVVVENPCWPHTIWISSGDFEIFAYRKNIGRRKGYKPGLKVSITYTVNDIDPSPLGSILVDAQLICMSVVA